MTRIGIAVLALICISALAQTTPVDSAQQQVQQAIRQFGEAWARNDLATLDRMLAPEYLHTDIRGQALNKTEWLAYVKSRKSRGITNADIEFDDVKVHIYGDVAIATGLNRLKGPAYGDEAERGHSQNAIHSLRFTQVWVRRQGRWLRITFQATPIAKQ